MFVCVFFFCKQKTAYEMRISDWSSDVCSSDLDVQIDAVERHDRAVALGDILQFEHRRTLTHRRRRHLRRGWANIRECAFPRPSSPARPPECSGSAAAGKSVVTGRCVGEGVDFGGPGSIKKKISGSSKRLNVMSK